MRIRFAIAALIWPMIQAVLFGLGIVGLLVAGLEASQLLNAVWWMIGVTFVVSVPIAWGMAPWLRLRDRPHESKLTRPGA
jgi:membrane protein implicated in regulation of membrane protease activity